MCILWNCLLCFVFTSGPLAGGPATPLVPWHGKCRVGNVCDLEENDLVGHPDRPILVGRQTGLATSIYWRHVSGPCWPSLPVKTRCLAGSTTGDEAAQLSRTTQVSTHTDSGDCDWSPRRALVSPDKNVGDTALLLWPLPDGSIPNAQHMAPHVSG